MKAEGMAALLSRLLLSPLYASSPPLALPGLGNRKPILSSHFPLSSFLRCQHLGDQLRLLCPWKPREVGGAWGLWARGCQVGIQEPVSLGLLGKQCQSVS